jgi:hypothetical protein
VRQGGFQASPKYSSTQLSVQDLAFVISTEAGIQRRRPVIGRGLNENETSTKEVSFSFLGSFLNPAFTGVTVHLLITVFCGRVLELQRYFDEMLTSVGQAFQPAMRIRPQGRLESLPYKSRPSVETSL